MNMALDEALLESAARTYLEVRPTAVFRIYRWARPTLSLGYFQAAAERDAHEPSRECDLVRRPSGGGAILHHHELTYALILPEHIAGRQPAERWYFDVHGALIEAIAQLTGATATLCENPTHLPASQQPFLCFQRRAIGDVLLGEHKIAGSAQRRRRGAILQHGSVLLAQSSYVPELPGISDLVGETIEFSHLAEAFSMAASHGLHFEFQDSAPCDLEIAAATRLCATRYGAEAWTQRR